ncbi:hypothetical protein K9L05_02090 [Candidatus Babeliales bacterium]|nr:hypothetical protein [Candidatus Babeliales bacterium]MCF7899419.1 hypothetical protein [Candidatus Babeliales bacterium]
MKKIFLSILVVLICVPSLLQAKEKEKEKEKVILTVSDYEKKISDINKQIYKAKKDYQIKQYELYNQIKKIELEKNKALNEYIKYELKQSGIDKDKNYDKYEKKAKDLENKFKKEKAQEFDKKIESLLKDLEELPYKLDKKIDQLRKYRTNLMRLKRHAPKKIPEKIPEAGILPKELKKAKKVK